MEEFQELSKELVPVEAKSEFNSLRYRNALSIPGDIPVNIPGTNHEVISKIFLKLSLVDPWTNSWKYSR